MNRPPELPGYSIIKKLGHGGMADVYLGVQKTLDRQVAIKILIPSLFRDDQFSKRFIKEAQTAARLSHPNIITIHDVGRAEDNYYIVMEFLQESLHDRLKASGPLPVKEALEIIKMVAAALDYAHKKGFIHRDIKSDNIMFRADGTAVLVDFGIARAIDSTTQLTRTGTSIGTPHYMSPEQCRGEKIDGRSDIYSLGVELYELLTGQVPYKAENTAGIILKHIQAPIPKLPDSMGMYQPLIEKMMAKDKTLRIQNGQELIKFIEAYQNSGDYFSTTQPTNIPVDSDQEPTILTPHSNAAITVPDEAPAKKGPMAGLIFLLVVVALGTGAYFFWPRNVADKKPEPIIQNLENKSTKDADKGQQKQEAAKDEGKTETDAQVNEQNPAALEKENSGKVENKPAETKENQVQPVQKETVKNDVKTDPAAVQVKKPIKSSPKESTQKETLKPNSSEREPQTKSLLKKESQKEKPQSQQLVTPKKVEVVKPKPKKVIKEVTLLNLSPGLLKVYHKSTQRVRMNLRRTIRRVTGQILVNLTVNEQGRVRVASFNHQLKVIPLLATSHITKAIKMRLELIKLTPPPKNKQGKPVQLKNWRITYKVGKLGKVLILTNQK